MADSEGGPAPDPKTANPGERGGLGPIGQIAVTVRDLDRSVDFYRDTLGMTLRFRAGGMAFFDAGRQRLMLGPPDGDPPTVEPDRPQFILYFSVEDIEATHERLAGAGVEFSQPPHEVADMGDHELWMAFFRDPDGYTLSLMSKVPAA